MTSRAMPQCHACRHFKSPFLTDDFGGPVTCDAFPTGIPDRVFANQVDHRQPIDGDHGVRWESADGEAFPEFAFAESVLGRSS